VPRTEAAVPAPPPAAHVHRAAATLPPDTTYQAVKAGACASPHRMRK
jgi:hypothetical protein